MAGRNTSKAVRGSWERSIWAAIRLAVGHLARSLFTWWFGRHLPIWQCRLCPEACHAVGADFVLRRAMQSVPTWSRLRRAMQSLHIYIVIMGPADPVDVCEEQVTVVAKDWRSERCSTEERKSPIEQDMSSPARFIDIPFTAPRKER